MKIVLSILFIISMNFFSEQKIDLANPDEVINVGWDQDNQEKANEIITEFSDWMYQHKDELMALQIFYNQPYRRRELTGDHL